MRANNNNNNFELEHGVSYPKGKAYGGLKNNNYTKKPAYLRAFVFVVPRLVSPNFNTVIRYQHVRQYHWPSSIFDQARFKNRW